MAETFKSAMRLVRRAWCFVGVHGGVSREAISYSLDRHRCESCGRVLFIRSIDTGAVYRNPLQIADELRVPPSVAALHFQRRESRP